MERLRSGFHRAREYVEGVTPKSPPQKDTRSGPTQTTAIRPQGDCATCHGFRFVYSRDIDHVTDHRHTSRPCPDCSVSDAEIAARQARRKARSGIPTFHGSFATYVADSAEKGGALDAAVEWSRGAGKPWLFLHGGTGVGKSHLATAAASQALQSVPVLYRVVADLLAELRTAIAKERRDQVEALNSEDLVREYRDVPVLVLDDLGAHNQTDYAQDTIMRILGHRYVERMPTLITTNADPDSLDPRLVDRLRDGAQCREVRMDWASFRVTADSLGVVR